MYCQKNPINLPVVEAYIKFYLVNPWLRMKKMAWEQNRLLF